MRKLILSALVVAALVSVATSSAGDRHGRVTGSFTVLSENYTPIGTVGEDTFFNGQLTLAYEGGLTGPAADSETFVVHSDGTFDGRGVEVCTGCTMGGRTGDFAAAFTLTGGPSFTDFSGRLTFICGAGGLAGLRGGGRFVGTAEGNTYSYAYRFARRAAPCDLGSEDDD